MRLRHRTGGCASAAVPSGQQMSVSETLAGFGGRGSRPPRGRLSMTSNSSGSAVTAPYWPGKGVPSGRPTHTPTVYARVPPIAQASRKP